MTRKYILLFCLGLLSLLFISSICDKTTDTDEEDVIQPGEIYVDIYDPQKACDGTTMFADLHDMENPRIIEVDMQGNIVWEYKVPDDLKKFHSPGMDVEYLTDDDHILFVLPGKGVYEIDRAGTVIWTRQDDKISHDADRLPSGNTIYIFGDNDTQNDPCVKEVNPSGQIVWSWYAKNDYNVAPYDTLFRQGWIHANSVTRMFNGNTILGLRNFNLTIEVNPQGTVV